MLNEQGNVPGQYLYERLGDKRFQQLCAALLKLSQPDVTCYPVGQSDGGRDIVSGNDRSVIFQVKWAKKQPSNPVSWLENAIKNEADNIRALTRAGANEYVLMTSVVGTAPRGRGTMDQLDSRLKALSKSFGVSMRCEWREDIDRRLESAPSELKWTYQEILAGVEAVQYLVEADSVAVHEQGLRRLLLKVMETQWQDDAKVKFKQVELESRNLMELFVDVEAIRVAEPRRNERLTLGSRYSQLAERTPVSLGGAAAFLLSTNHPLTVVRGAPGQGKSTLGQYLCQVYRADFVPDDAYRGGATPPTRVENPRVPIRVDLREYGTWLAGGDPFADDDDPPSKANRTERKQGSVEQFLVKLLHTRSGGLPVTVANVQDVLHRFPVLIVLDGLDEVALPRLRDRVVKEIDEFSARLGASLNVPQLIVTTRPNASGMAEPSPDTFETIALSGLSPKLRTVYLRKWTDALGIRGKDRRDLERTFHQRSAEPHIRALADNPMQLTILLYLIKKRGSSVPTARTELYTSYMETLLDREAAKTPAVEEFRKDLEEVTSYLGWYLQSRAETTGNEGRLGIKALRKAILRYLVGVEKDTDMVDALFTGVTDRVWALSSRVQGTFEFDVQPLREYFAARFLNEFAGADLPEFDKAAVLRQLVRRAYWHNTARFFTGFANPNELAGLVEALADECEERDHPRQVRLAAWTLLADGVFKSRTRTKRSAAALFGDDLSIRLLAHALTSDPENPVPANDRGGQEIVDLFYTQLSTHPTSPLTCERVAIVMRLQDRRAFDEWWQPKLRDAAGRPQQMAWLKMGASVHAASRLDADDVEMLDLSDDATLPDALAAGIIPSPGSSLEARMIQAIVAGQCSDVRGASPGVPAEMLKIIAPQHFLRKASTRDVAYIVAVGHLDTPIPDHQRHAAMRRLIAHDERFRQIQRALRFNRGQAGTTSPWGNTARSIAAIYGPCWLAAEIAVHGAALSRHEYVTSGDFTKGADSLGPAVDYGSLLREIRFNAIRSSWWTDQFIDHEDNLSRATWALALMAVASPEVIVDNLGNLDRATDQLPPSMLDALLASSSRLALGRVGNRRLPDDVLRAASISSPATSLLVAHHASILSRDRPYPLPQYSEQQLAEHSRYGISAWPALMALAARMTTNRSSTLLGSVRRFEANAISDCQVPFESGSEELARTILDSPREYPLAWVLGAEKQISHGTRDTALATVADDSEWFAQ
ncbi:NACHT domain-containing protein [Actinophytocola sp.]|uniref:NACHT domain-containing protein n=1 Tax=Actinophytocola sp. TaxID=1872138 RepID=UPI003D6BA999